MQIYDTHKELLIQPYRKGVKLAKPVMDKSNFPTISDILDLPLAVYFLNRDSLTLNLNDLTLLTNAPPGQGYTSKKDHIGKNLLICCKRDSAEKIMYNDTIVYYEREMKIIEEEMLRLDEINFSGISFKFPLYDDSNKIIGIFGMTVIADTLLFPTMAKLPTALEAIINLGLFPQNNTIISYKNLLPGCEISGAYLSTQETKCLNLLIRGQTIKMIGKVLDISPRTVEHYLESVKRKLNVYSKPELIDKVVSYFWPEISS